jgi:hypothetical protein
LNNAVAPSVAIKKFFEPECEAGSVLFFYISQEEYEIEG